MSMLTSIVVGSIAYVVCSAIGVLFELATNPESDGPSLFRAAVFGPYIVCRLILNR